MAGQGAVGPSAGIEGGGWGTGMEAAGGAVEVGEQGMIFFVIQIFWVIFTQCYFFLGSDR